MKKILTLSLIILVFTLTQCDESTSPKFEHSGIVTDTNGNPIEDATVTLLNKSTSTDRNGVYYFSGVSNGIHQIIVTKENYNLAIKDVVVITHQIINGAVVLLKLVDAPEGMVYVKGGTFQMGSTSGENNEQPTHIVTIDDFYIGKYEVTHKDYIKFLNVRGVSRSGFHSGTAYIDMDASDCAVGHNGSFYFKGSAYASTENTPVMEVTWHGAVAYCLWAGGRLPTEAEWEYASKGGASSSGYTYSGSNTAGNVAWCSSNSSSKSHEVGTKQPNELGLYDMSGNLWEWCSDKYSKSYYDNSPSNNPQGPTTGGSPVVRGGSWFNIYQNSRSTMRHSSPFSNNIIGFRVVQDKP